VDERIFESVKEFYENVKQQEYSSELSYDIKKFQKKRSKWRAYKL
jgi:hypothetical protein